MAITAIISEGVEPIRPGGCTATPGPRRDHPPLLARGNHREPRAARIGHHQVAAAADRRRRHAHRQTDPELGLAGFGWRSLGRPRPGIGGRSGAALGRRLLRRRARGRAAAQRRQPRRDGQRRAREDAALSRGNCQT